MSRIFCEHIVQYQQNIVESTYLSDFEVQHARLAIGFVAHSDASVLPARHGDQLMQQIGKKGWVKVQLDSIHTIARCTV